MTTRDSAAAVSQGGRFLPRDAAYDMGFNRSLLLVSTHEGWPNFLLESMACGTLVVVSDINGIGEIVAAPEAGRILAETTPAALAGAIRDLLAAPTATRRYAELFDWQSTTQGQIDLFREICEPRR